MLLRMGTVCAQAYAWASNSLVRRGDDGHAKDGEQGNLHK